jgi:hypothetical protein
MPSYLPPSAGPSPHGSSATLCVPTSSGESVSSRPQKRQRVQSSSSSVAGNPGQPHEYAARAALFQQQQQQQQQQQSTALKNGVTTVAVGGGGAGTGAQKFSNANGYMGTGGQKATGGGVAGGNAAKQQHQNYMRSPSSSHASLHSNTPVSVVGGGSTPAAMIGRNSVPTPMAPTPSPSNGDVKPLLPIEEGPATIRVREEGGAETFALPLAMVNSWEVC